MTDERYVLLGLARPRATWFREVGQWATTAAIPAEFLKCVSAEELRARLATGRVFSGVLLDASLPSVDRDLLDAARSAGCAVLVVDDGRSGRDWAAMGAAAVLPPGLARETLVEVLAGHAVAVGGADPTVLDPGGAAGSPDPVGQVAAVCGAGGAGASTVAAAVAQGLGRDGRFGRIVLADLALNGEQGMLHDVRDVAPGVQELVEAHRSRRLGRDEVESLLFEVPDRGYHLLLGLRRARYWSGLRPRALDAGFDSLRRHFDVVVADVTADFEGEEEGGSADLEDRNRLARMSVRAAGVVFAVGLPGVKGLHSLVRVLSDLVGVGVAPGRIVPVVNRAPRQPRARAELSGALASLAEPALAGRGTVAPIFLPSRRIDESVRDAVPVPPPLPGLLAAAFTAVLRRTGPAIPATVEPVLVSPGSLGISPRGDAG